MLDELKGFGLRDRSSVSGMKMHRKKSNIKKVISKQDICAIMLKIRKGIVWLKKETKKLVSKASSKAFKEIYEELWVKNGERKIYKIAKNWERKTRYLDLVKCIKDEGKKNLVTDADI